MAGNSADKPRVLYVEDEKDLQDLMTHMLQFLGYEITCADNGKMGVERAEEWKPDVILMDVRMPVMDGPEAIAVLRSKPDTKDTPIYVVSAYNDAATRDACKQAGADDFFTKPIDIEKINATIKAALV